MSCGKQLFVLTVHCGPELVRIMNEIIRFLGLFEIMPLKTHYFEGINNNKQTNTLYTRLDHFSTSFVSAVSSCVTSDKLSRWKLGI